MSELAVPTCIGEPISWPRLERFALDPRDAEIRTHLDGCPACRTCLLEIERDVVALPPLAVPATPAPRRWWHAVLPAGLAIAAAAAILLLVLRPRDPSQAREGLAHVKGLGTVEIVLVRERDGVVRDDVRTFAAGDRWKVLVTCAADRVAAIEVSVREAGARETDRPLAPARITCGNRIPLPGAFALTGTHPHEVCVRVQASDEPGVACISLRAE
jgi:hypothetical protein